jgi:hypothetical protein
MLVVSTSRFFPHSRRTTGFVTRLTRRVPLVEQALLTLPEHLSSPPVFSGVRVTRSLYLYVCFVDRCLSVCTFFAMVLSVLLRYTISDCSFGIFKLFFCRFAYLFFLNISSKVLTLSLGLESDIFILQANSPTFFWRSMTN